MVRREKEGCEKKRKDIDENGIDKEKKVKGFMERKTYCMQKKRK
jgi:hypothetical protein